MKCGRWASLDTVDLDDPALSACAAGMQNGRHSPIFSGFGQFSLYILALEKQGFCPPFHEWFREADKLV